MYMIKIAMYAQAHLYINLPKWALATWSNMCRNHHASFRSSVYWLFHYQEDARAVTVFQSVIERLSKGNILFGLFLPFGFWFRILITPNSCDVLLSWIKLFCASPILV